MKFLFRKLLPLLFVPMTWCLTASAQTNQDAVLLTIAGKVDVAKAGGDAWAAGQANLALKIGDKVRTGKSSRATLRLSNLSVIRVYESSTMEIQPPQQAGHSAGMDLKSGAAYFFNRDKPMETQFRTPSASGAIRGTEFALNVDANGHTEVALIDGQVDLKNDAGAIQLNSGEKGTVDMGKAPQKTALINALNIIQWTLYYPAILDVAELQLGDEVKDSVAAYRSGDLLGALAKYPADRVPATDSEKFYRAGLLLAVGKVDEAQAMIPKGNPLEEMIAAVKGETYTRTAPRQTVTEWLAGSYYAQSKQNLPEALEMARKAVKASAQFGPALESLPRSGYAQERVAELEFSFGHTEAALAALDQSLAVAPRNAQALALKGFLLSAQNRNTEAMDFFNQAIAADGSLANGWLGRGLSRIRSGHSAAGRSDLQVAAALEPNRSILRSYLGKAFSNAGDDTHAAKEFALARKLDAADPTAPFYSALLNQRRNRINEAVDDLEKSQDLNDNRSVYRSRMLLDQDKAVRGANLALIYQDAGMTDLSLREASRAVQSDYANYSAHLFLSDSYDSMRDPTTLTLRYETPAVSEYLLGTLLAPVGGSVLSRNISQQEYSRFFEGDHTGIISDTEYLSRGAWAQLGSVYGTSGKLAYAVDTSYTSDRGQRANNDLNQLQFSVQAKAQLTPQDSLFVQAIYADSTSGDLIQYYNQTSANLGLRVREWQDPIVLAGFHHEWNPNVHTLFLAARLVDTLNVANPGQQDLLIPKNAAGKIVLAPFPIIPPGADNYRSGLEIYSGELQQIFQQNNNSVIFGALVQEGQINAFNQQPIVVPFPALTLAPSVGTQTDYGHFNRESAYAYDNWHVADPLLLVGGVSYDRMTYPQNYRYAPINHNEESHDQFSPKAGVIWVPEKRTTVRAGYSRSFGGVSFDQSFRLEPTEIAGLNQSYRSLMPESVVGPVSNPRFETWTGQIEHRFPTRTYVAVTGSILRSDADRTLGAFDVTDSSGPPPYTVTASGIRQSLRYKEQSLALTVNQLIGDEWSVGARYSITKTDLKFNFPAVPLAAENIATLNQLDTFALWNLPCGFFTRGDVLWTMQNNRGYTTPLPGDDYWQMNMFVGYRFPRRAAQVQVGILNLTDQDYHLNPLSLYAEVPHQRTFTASFKFSF